MAPCQRPTERSTILKEILNIHIYMRVNFDGHDATSPYDVSCTHAQCKMFSVSKVVRVYVMVKDDGLPLNLKAYHLFWGKRIYFDGHFTTLRSEQVILHWTLTRKNSIHLLSMENFALKSTIYPLVPPRSIFITVISHSWGLMCHSARRGRMNFTFLKWRHSFQWLIMKRKSPEGLL